MSLVVPSEKVNRLESEHTNQQDNVSSLADYRHMHGPQQKLFVPCPPPPAHRVLIPSTRPYFAGPTYRYRVAQRAHIRLN